MANDEDAIDVMLAEARDTEEKAPVLYLKMGSNVPEDYVKTIIPETKRKKRRDGSYSTAITCRRDADCDFPSVSVGRNRAKADLQQDEHRHIRIKDKFISSQECWLKFYPKIKDAAEESEDKVELQIGRGKCVVQREATTYQLKNTGDADDLKTLKLQTDDIIRFAKLSKGDVIFRVRLNLEYEGMPEEFTVVIEESPVSASVDVPPCVPASATG